MSQFARRACTSIGALLLAAGPLVAPNAVAASTISHVKVAFLMPDEGSTRYEEHDRPGFVREMKILCPTCTVLYQNADGDASRQQQQQQQQQQFNSVISQGAKAIVLDRSIPPPRPLS